MPAEVLKVSIEEPESHAIHYAASLVQRGRVVGVPTDTFYGLCADPYNLAAIGRVFEVKGRAETKALPILVNCVEQAVILSRDGVLDLANFSGVSVRPVVPSYPDQLEKLVDVQRAHILRVLESTNWRIEGTTGAAKILGLCASTLRTRMRKLGIRRPVQSPASGVSRFPAAVSEPGRFSGFRAAAS